MRKLIVVLSTFALLLGVAPAANAGGKGPLQVATSLPAPGFWNGDTPDTIDGGFEWALAGELADALGYDGFELKNVSFGGLVAGKAKGFDIALSQASITKERKKVVDFSTPYYISDNGIMVKEGTEVPDVETARTLTWGVQTGSTHVAFMKKSLKPDEPVKLFGETTEMFAALTAGQIDAAMTDTSILLAQAGQPGSGFEVVGQFKATSGFYGAIFAKGSKLRPKVNKVIKALEADGTLEALLEEWLVPEFGADPRTVPYLEL
ncbi:MAG: ABC transporter substrate-binding protein [Acidimicrobiia bacterium]